MDFSSIWVILKLRGVEPKNLKRTNAGGSGSDQSPDRKAREPCPDRANNNCSCDVEKTSSNGPRIVLLLLSLTWHPLETSANIPYPSWGHAKLISPRGGTTARGGGGCSCVAPSTITAANAIHKARAFVAAVPGKQEGNRLLDLRPLRLTMASAVNFVLRIWLEHP